MANNWSATRQAEENLLKRNSETQTLSEITKLTGSIEAIQRALVELNYVEGGTYEGELISAIGTLGSLQAKLQRKLTQRVVNNE